MNKQDIKNLIALASGSFPSIQKTDLVQIGKTWEEMFGKYEYQLVRDALRTVLIYAKFFPSVSEIQEAINSLRSEQTNPKPIITDCPNCRGNGYLTIRQDGEERYCRCPCKAGERLSGWPTAPGWALDTSDIPF